MPMADTKLNQIGPDTAQLSTNLSFIEKTQLAAIRSTGASLTSRPGTGDGSVSRSLNGVNNYMKSTLDIGASLAQKMEQAGAVRQNTSEFITNNLTTAVRNKTSLAQKDPKVKDLSDPQNRVPIKKYSVTEIIKKKKESLLGLTLANQGDTSYAGNVFPADLEEKAKSYIVLVWKEYKRNDPMTEGSVSGSTTIRLPLPENFAFTHNIRLQEADSEMAGALLKKVNATTVEQAGKGNFEAAFGALKSQIMKQTGEDIGGFISEVANRSAYSALSDASPILGGLAGQVVGAIPNPHPTVFFKGVDLRQFTWNWKMVPRTQEDAANIRQIIQTLRKLVIPDSSGTYLKYPSICIPRVEGGYEELYGKFRRSMVSQLSINFSAEGSSAFFVDGHPVAISLGMNFMEIENADPE
jgi:hypothetical protein